ALRQHEQWYKGDGIYGDGPALHFDYYNSFVIHPMLIDVLDACRDEVPAWKELTDRVDQRARRYAAIQERRIAPDGRFPPFGRPVDAGSRVVGAVVSDRSRAGIVRPARVPARSCQRGRVKFVRGMLIGAQRRRSSRWP